MWAKQGMEHGRLSDKIRFEQRPEVRVGAVQCLGRGSSKCQGPAVGSRDIVAVAAG